MGDALDCVFGYLVINDVSARDRQFHSPTFTMGKPFDTHGPIVPYLVTADEIADPQALTVRCIVNGEVRQEGNTPDTIHKIADQTTYLSTAFTLEPNDIIATGTPKGVGVTMDPPQFLQSGDVRGRGHRRHREQSRLSNAATGNKARFDPAELRIRPGLFRIRVPAFDICRNPVCNLRRSPSSAPPNS
ncbi:fumarylacetoacetate hydrolase family protein [Croceicoccus naphthovorans]|uniref:fumarylacetoacetate hydrolase family protein n=1 Tax=Croceicoccus naphthovorans TaxID=1348774 RepID=UPI000B334615|nr:fumarylacetoacetate hydrolase family protein [Croceicoccus naphthovorans]MBB3990121.1 2-keto-4-pentenoate hydratase/2-oxohepta-3-ene-1,7-dioic acid hydratase in catechol pathway [Croceicoccus naphthovorans]